MRTGTNRILIDIGLVPRDICADFYVDNLWVTIDSSSLVHVPLVPSLADRGDRSIDLSLYPELLSLSPEQGSVAFVLPEDDLAAWQVAGQIAFHLGDQTDWGLAEFATYYGDSVPSEIGANHDLVLVGRPTSLPILSDLEDVLPVPFEQGSNLATLQDLQVVYRLPETATIGYLELLEAPWDEERLVLAVLGSNEQGLVWAGNALTVPELSGNLAGDFALVNGEKIVTADTRVRVGVGSAVTTAVPETETEVVAQPEETYSPQRPVWVLPAIGVAVILMIVVAVFAGLSDLRGRAKTIRGRKKKAKDQTEQKPERQNDEERPFY
jgi:hypothetical protein